MGFCPPVDTSPWQSGTGQPTVRPAVWYAVVGLAALLVVSLAYRVDQQGIVREQVRLAAESAEMERRHAEEVAAADLVAQQQAAAEESAHQRRLGDGQLLSGAAARENHDREWRRRLAHEPSLAASILETNLLRMERIGRDPALAAQAALEQVARLASPPGSRVEVTQGGEGLVVRIAFKMSAVTTQEEGAVTKHHTVASMRREVEELSARLIQEEFDYCGARGIARLSVSCNHAVRSALLPKGVTKSEEQYLMKRAGLVMSSLYRVSLDGAQAATVVDWRAISVPQVIRMLRVEKDGLKTLAIEGQAKGEDQEDPSMPLEF